MAATLREFYRDYLQALDAGDAALFVGAGMSVANGYVNWKELLREIAADLGLDINRETDLVSLAQFHLNTKRNRASLNSRLLQEFTKDAQSSENHRLIAALPIRTIWTTNYDTLLEGAFRDFDKRPDVKSSQLNLSQSVPQRDVTIYKMHGDVGQPHEAVITRDDYERYSKTRGLFVEKLQGDLVSKTFLYLGFSFTDPNVDYILGRIRVLLDQNVRQHYCVMRRPQAPKSARGASRAEFEYELRKYELRSDDLSRYGISVIDINDYGEITQILQELNRRGHRREVFVSGSVQDYGPLGKDRLERLARHIGEEIIRHDYNLVSGFGLGIGGVVLMGALEALHHADRGRQEGRTVLRPFPQAKPSKKSDASFTRKYRTDMISQCGSVIFLSGNKAKPSGRGVREAEGVIEEFKIAKSLKRYPIPIGASGHAARTIWNEVMSNVSKFYPASMNVQEHLRTLGHDGSSDQQIVDAIFSILRATATN